MMGRSVMGVFLVRWRGVLLCVHPYPPPSDVVCLGEDGSEVENEALRELLDRWQKQIRIYTPEKIRVTAADVYVDADSPACHWLLMVAMQYFFPVTQETGK